MVCPRCLGLEAEIVDTIKINKDELLDMEICKVCKFTYYPDLWDQDALFKMHQEKVKVCGCCMHIRLCEYKCPAGKPMCEQCNKLFDGSFLFNYPCKRGFGCYTNEEGIIKVEFVERVMADQKKEYEKEGFPFYCKQCGKDKDFEFSCTHEDPELRCGKCDSDKIESYNELMEWGNTYVLTCQECHNSERYTL